MTDNHTRWSYLELAAAVDYSRNRLIANGIGHGDAVVVLSPLRNATVAAYLAILQTGAVTVLLDRRCGPSDIRAACENTRPSAGFVADDDALRATLARYCPTLTFEEIDRHTTAMPAADTETIHPVLDPDAAAVVVFTSGTTSTLKGVIHTLNTLRCGTQNMITALGITGADTLYLSSPLASITGILQIESVIRTHASLVIDEHFTAAGALGGVRRHDATIIGGAPVIAESLLKEATAHGVATLPLRCIAMGGSPIPRRLRDAAARFGVDMVRIYGSSEAPVSSSTGLSDASRDDDGSALPGVRFAIDDAEKSNELLVDGPHRFCGYIEQEHNADTFVDDWLRAGDQARLEGDCVTITGRVKDIVVRKRMKISLAEIDAAAATWADSAAFGVADDVTGERLVLAVRTDTPADISHEAMVAALMDAGLAKYKLPEQIVLWEGAFPRTTSGKIIRQRLSADWGRHQSIYAPRLPNL